MSDKTNMRMREKPCRTCGRVGHWHTYCSDACKQRAYRKRKDEKRLGAIAAIDSWMIEDLGNEVVVEINRHLNAIPGKKYNEEINAALEILIQSYHSEIRKSKSGRKIHAP